MPSIPNLFNVALLVGLLYKFLNKLVRKMFQDRRNRILDEIETAGKNKEQAIALRTEYQNLLDNITQEKKDIIKSAHNLATEKTEEQLAEARNEADSLKARTQKEIEMEQERAKSDMQQKIIGVSSAMATKFLVKAIDADTHEQLFNEAMAELEGIAWHS